MLLSTFAALYWLRRQRPQFEVLLAAALGSLCAMALSLHVFSWISLGVIMPQTYILFFLSALCLGLNLWAVVPPASLRLTLPIASDAHTVDGTVQSE